MCGVSSGPTSHSSPAGAWSSLKKYIEEAFDKYCGKGHKVFSTPVQTSSTEAFSQIKPANEEPKKSAEAVKRKKVIGGSIDGVDGPVSAPVHVLGQMMQLSTFVAGRGVASGEVGQRLLGNSIFPAMFRRDVLALMEEVFSDVEKEHMPLPSPPCTRRGRPH